MVKKKQSIRPEKEADLLQKIRDAIERSVERSITRPEYLYVLKNGRHEKRKMSLKKNIIAGTMPLEVKQLMNESYMLL